MVHFNKEAEGSLASALERFKRVSWSFLVAGPGVAPGPSDYEPDEVLFLHPALKPPYSTRPRKTIPAKARNYVFLHFLCYLSLP